MFGVFNIGFTVFMFILPTIGLVYWYLYIRDPAGGLAPKPQQIIQQAPAAPRSKANTERQQTRPAKPEQQPLTSGFFDEPFGSAGETLGSGEVEESMSQPPQRQQYELRTWTDESGNFSIRARFFSIIGERVKIVADDDGREVEVLISKLSESDKEYLRAIYREKGIQPRF